MADYSYGGQAVIEGNDARQKENGRCGAADSEEIVFDLQPVNSLSERYRLLRVPLFAGWWP